MKYQELLYLARAVLEAHFNNKQVEIPENVKEKFGEDGACFITLTKEGELRGCIGSLEARQPLYEDVIENTINAACGDPRFLQLDEEELEEIKIELSVLSKPEKLKYKNSEDILERIDKNMGIVLKLGGRSATFLPQVWEQIPDKEVFLEQLAMKAGLGREDWKDAELWFYRVEKVEED